MLLFAIAIRASILTYSSRDINCEPSRIIVGVRVCGTSLTYWHKVFLNHMCKAHLSRFIHSKYMLVIVDVAHFLFHSFQSPYLLEP